MRFCSFGLGLLVGSLSLGGLVACGSDDDEAAQSNTIPAGGACKADDDVPNHGCVGGTKCGTNAGSSGSICLVLEGGECDADKPYCADELVCAELESGGQRCFGAVVLHGEVRDASDASPIEDAHVMALNDEGTAVTDVAHTDAKGNYDLAVPAKRNADGTPSDKFTLRAAAQDYQAFPSGVRVALPIDTSEARASEGKYEVENALTTIDLIPLDAGDRSQISGSIVAREGSARGATAGVLVVATGADSVLSGISDQHGDFTVFNVTEGDYELKGYGADIQIEAKSVSVAAKPLSGVELVELDEGTTSVSGNVQIVNAPGGSTTSVILVVEDTFDPDAARGEVPRGLRAPKKGDPNVSGSFTISGVPAGKYVVLAAYENDGLVRDPDTNISGTDFVHLVVPAGAGSMTIGDSFKVTEALATIRPGADGPEAVTEKPMLVWADDSSEDWYDVHVYDAFGNQVWESLQVQAGKGSSDVSVQYEGPLEPGMYYQYRASSWRQPGNGDAAPISMTEDLLGVFFMPAE